MENDVETCDPLARSVLASGSGRRMNLVAAVGKGTVAGTSHPQISGALDLRDHVDPGHGLQALYLPAGPSTEMEGPVLDVSSPPSPFLCSDCHFLSE